VTRPTPRPSQLVGRDFLAARSHALLADQMRVGKTPQAILACEAVGARNILVVCPAIAVPQWKREFARWAPHLPNPTVVSYERARRDVEVLAAMEWDVLIPDECHFAKNPETGRTKAIYGKGGIGWSAKRIWPLSGTPAPNHAAELWPMMRAFGVVGLTYNEFVNRYCLVQQPGMKITGTRADRIPELRELLGKFMLRRTRAEVAPELPDVELDFLYLQPDWKALKHLDMTGLESRMLELPEDERLPYLERQFDTLAELRNATAVSKAIPLATTIEENIHAKLLPQTVVFGWHIEALEIIRDRLRAAGITTELLYGGTSDRKRQSIQTDFASGKVEVVVANIVTAGTAIDLSAADHGYFLELDWVPANNAQASNRIVSMMKNSKVSFDIATIPGSVDELIQRSLKKKTAELRALF
jgi:SNF2 family DNA or RNA helicase